ncbi:MAG: thiamine pyrophosphate-dependent enzyme [Hyphomicrobiaceae bacterium]
MNDQKKESGRSSAMRRNARLIAAAGGIDPALQSGQLPKMLGTTLSEGLVLGLLRQGVRKYFGIFGHGSTDLAEVLRIYDEEGVTRTINCRNEVAMAHAATCLSWQFGEVPAVVTSIGPGALQAMAGSLASASNGVGVYHIYGDETTFGEGYNMQQIPKEAQGLFGQLTAVMGQSYVLHTPEALRDCLRRGSNCVHHPYKAGPFYVLLPLNTQPAAVKFNLEALPKPVAAPAIVPVGAESFEQAAALISKHHRICIKAGGGTRGFDDQLTRLAESVGAAVALSPGSTGVLSDAHPQNMHVGGSKGTISGNYAMSESDLVVVIGSRGVCQADCSGIGYAAAEAVINVNGDLSDLTHYNKTVGLQGDIGAVIDRLLAVIESGGGVDLAAKQDWLKRCAAKKAAWAAFKSERTAASAMHDDVWDRAVLGQPSAISIASQFAKSIGAAKYFDAGDVQANGFQIVEDDRTGDTFTEAGASYMGFAVSALLASAVADKKRYGIAFSGDGSFMMNPQVLIDAVEHGVHGMIVIFDNRRMAAITGLQRAQYDHEFRTNDAVPVDYVQMANAVAGVKALSGGSTAESLRKALLEAHAYPGLSVVHVPVYFGDNPLGEMGAYGSWNVGNWCEDVQSTYISQDI